MAGSNPQGYPEPVTAGPVRIVLEFSGPDSATVALRAEGIAPGQLFLAAWYLDAVAREVRAGQLQQSILGELGAGDLARVARDIMAGRGRSQ